MPENRNASAWFTIPNPDAPEHPDHVLTLETGHALWLQYFQGYDACLVRTKTLFPEVPESRANVDLTLHVAPLTVAGDGGHNPEGLKSTAISRMADYARAKLRDAETDMKEWKTIQDALAAAGNPPKATVFIRKRFRHREGWFAEIGRDFAVFVENPTRQRPDNERIYNWEVLEGSSRKIVQHGLLFADGPQMAIDVACERAVIHIREHARFYARALKDVQGLRAVVDQTNPEAPEREETACQS